MSLFNKMKDKKQIKCDLLVIGAGFAGMVAAARASFSGLKTVQAGSSSQLYFASGLFDLLGVYPLSSKAVLQEPQAGLKLLQKQMPGHPYSKAGIEKIEQSLDFTAQFLQSTGLAYAGSNRKNSSVLTSAGTFKPSFLVPETIAKGTGLAKETNLLIIDFQGLKGFSARQIAACLQEIHPNINILRIDMFGKNNNLNPIQLAAMFEDPLFLEQLARQINNFKTKADIMGMPAVCGINNSSDILARLEKMTGLDIFEIPMFPPSIPGLRLKNVFEKKLAAGNVHFLSQAEIKYKGFHNLQFNFNAVNLNLETQIESKGVILATGRFQGKGLHAQRSGIKETVFKLPVFQPDERNLWHHRNLFEKNGHMINTAGLETDKIFRPVDTKGNVIYENLYAAGTILAHNDWVRLKSGSGVSALSACTAVDDFHKKLLKKKETDV